MKRTAIVLALLICGAGSAAASKSYVDPSYGKVKYSDIVKPDHPYKLKLKVEFQRNGQHLPQVDSVILRQVDRVIRATGFAVPDPTSEGSDEMSIVLNNIADIAQAKRKGYVTGSTFYLKGSVVTDYYEMQASATISGKTITKSGYKHAIHSTIGLAKGPKGMPPMTAVEAVDKVVEELVLNFLGDLQKSELNDPSGTVSRPQLRRRGRLESFMQQEYQTGFGQFNRWWKFDPIIQGENVNHLTKRSTLLPLVLSLLLLFSSTLIAQDNLAAPMAAPASFGTFPGFRTSSDRPSSVRWNLTNPSLPLLPQVLRSNPLSGLFVKTHASDAEASTAVANSAALRLAPSPFQISSNSPNSMSWARASLPLSHLAQASGSNPSPASGSNPPKRPNWARRHALLLSGLALTGAGSAMMATGGDTQASGCLAVPPYGDVECTTVPTWGSGRHIGGLLLVSAGVPVTIWGLFRHN